MPFTLHIFESEFKEIENFVLQYQNIETGGDLFGLWTRDAEPVVQLIIGPGRKCRRTSVSFHQDTDYLQNVGTFVNTSFMLCHIGSWHSHHQLSLTQPSAGDRSTVCNNFPRGLQRYIMIIANIECSTRTGEKYVVIHPYMFTSEGRACKKGTVETISGTSPFREDGNVLRTLCQGAEQNRATSNLGYGNSTRARSPRIVHHSPSKTESQRSLKTSRNTHSGHGKKQWYTTPEGEYKLKKLNDQIRRKFNLIADVDFHRNRDSLDLTLEFPHNGKRWVIQFPASFDQEPARIQHSSNSSPIYSTNIVEDIQQECLCRSCTAMNGDTASAALLGNRDVGKVLNRGNDSARRQRIRYEQVSENLTSTQAPWYKTTDGKSKLETIRNQIHSFLSTNGGNKDMVKQNTSSNGGNVSLTFRHDDAEWFIEFPRNFPKEQARIYRKERRANKSFLAFLPQNNVVETLKGKCGCRRCARRSYSRQRNFSPARYVPSRHFARETNTPGGRHISSAYTTGKNNLGHHPVLNRVRTSRKSHQWYSTESGEKKLYKICTDISTLLLRGVQVDMTRSKSDADIRLEFDHHRYHWRIEFPSDYPNSPPEIGYYDRTEQYRPVTLRNKDIMSTIRSNCLCTSCRQYAPRVY